MTSKTTNQLIFNNKLLFRQKIPACKRFLCVAEYPVVGNMNPVGRMLTRKWITKDSELQDEVTVIQDE